MISKSEIKARTIIAEFEKTNIEKDIADTNLYLQEYVFIRVFFRIVFLFIVSFLAFSFMDLKDVIFDQDLLNIDLFLDIFNNVLIMTFAVCCTYILLVGLYIKSEYDIKKQRVEKYIDAKSYLEKIGENNE